MHFMRFVLSRLLNLLQIWILDFLLFLKVFMMLMLSSLKILPVFIIQQEKYLIRSKANVNTTNFNNTNQSGFDKNSRDVGGAHHAGDAAQLLEVAENLEKENNV